MAKPVSSKREPSSRGPALVEPVARPDWLIVLMAVAGLIVSGYLGWLKVRGGGALLCEAGGGCDIVQASRYATILGVPTALWGSAFYAAIGTLAGLGLSAQRWLWAFLLAAGGAAFSLYLTVIALLVIGAACPYCLASASIAVALVAVILWRRPTVRGRRSPLRWSRILPLGGVAALIAVVGGAAVFASYPGGASAYQTGLARHLAKINGVMYGAYW
jgi:uncharacterized membrane protein